MGQIVFYQISLIISLLTVPLLIEAFPETNSSGTVLSNGINLQRSKRSLGFGRQFVRRLVSEERVPGIFIRIPSGIGKLLKGGETEDYDYSNLHSTRPPYIPWATKRQSRNSKLTYYPTQSSLILGNSRGSVTRESVNRPVRTTTRRPYHNTHEGNENNHSRESSDIFDDPNCGKITHTYQDPDSLLRIVGGKDVNIEQYPWQVALEHADKGHFCGATVISKRWIITAAHCVVKENINLLHGLAGSKYLRSEQARRIEFKKLISHRSYRSDIWENDIALLQTKSDIPMYPSTDSINTACLPKENANFRGSVSVSGWGRTSEGEFDTNEILLATDIDIMDDDKCKEYYPQRFKQRTQFCAGVPEGGRDACQGDSGGPLIKNVGGRAYLIGIVSYGRGCGRRRSPGVYTKVSAYIDWIKSQINNN